MESIRNIGFSDISFTDIISSRPVTFKVGPEESEFVIHELAVTRVSDVFNAMMRSGMKEATERVIYLEHTAPAVFGSFVQYCYSNEYDDRKLDDTTRLIVQTPVERLAKDSSEPKTCDSANGLAEGQTSSITSSSEEPPAKKQKLLTPAPESELKNEKLATDIRLHCWERFRSYTYISPAFAEESPEAESLKRSIEGHQPSAVVLHHAAIYCLAEEYDVKGLRDLALHKLHHWLVVMRGMSGELQAILKLAQYTLSREQADVDVSRLKHEVIGYMVARMQGLRRHSEFYVLMEENAAFGNEIFTQFLEFCFT